FTGGFKKQFQIINLSDISKIDDQIINPALMRNKGLIKKLSLPVKVLGSGEIKKAKTIQAHAFSKQAHDKITRSGGKPEVLSLNA
ncbi:MAG: uL15 family ribosomal protein, partial [Candidatus Omnitrophica bacterium]|nr:uL15 family ribosomal protein [Candidatus Omnitrophota bacterium]